MQRVKRYSRIVILVSILVFVGCAIKSRAGDSEQMLTLGSALTKLSSAVESTVRYKNPPANISDADLLILATKHDPAILDAFTNYAVNVFRQDRHSIVLVCTKDRSRALLEDSNCTGGVDRNHWESRAPLPCEFTLSVPEVCGKQ